MKVNLSYNRTIGGAAVWTNMQPPQALNNQQAIEMNIGDDNSISIMVQNITPDGVRIRLDKKVILSNLVIPTIIPEQNMAIYKFGIKDIFPVTKAVRELPPNVEVEDDNID